MQKSYDTIDPIVGPVFIPAGTTLSKPSRITILPHRLVTVHRKLYFVVEGVPCGEGGQLGTWIIPWLMLAKRVMVILSKEACRMVILLNLKSVFC